MPEPTMDAVLARLDSLEKQNRRLKRWGAGILLFGLALGGMAMAQEEKVPELVRTRGLEVVDSRGAVRVRLGPVQRLEDVGEGLSEEKREYLRRNSPFPISYICVLDATGKEMLALSENGQPLVGTGPTELRLEGENGSLILDSSSLTLCCGSLNDTAFWGAVDNGMLFQMGQEVFDIGQKVMLPGTRGSDCVRLFQPFSARGLGQTPEVYVSVGGKTLFKVPE